MYVFWANHDRLLTPQPEAKAIHNVTYFSQIFCRIIFSDVKNHYPVCPKHEITLDPESHDR